MVEDSKNLNIKNLYPDLGPDDLHEAEENLRRYIELVGRIYQRLKRENKVPKMLIRAADKRRRKAERLKRRRNE